MDRFAVLRLPAGVERTFESGVDWRDGDAYSALLDADRSLFAWEWLRRHPSYRRAANTRKVGDPETGTPDAATFGLVCFEPPDARVPFARPIWRSDADPQVLVASSWPEGTAEQEFELDRCLHLAHLVASKSMHHLLLTDGLRTIRLDAPEGAIAGTRLSLCYPVPDRVSRTELLLPLQRLIALLHRGNFARSLHRREPRAARWILELRTYDAILAGAHQRDIAEELLKRSPAPSRWRSRDPSLRSQVQRLVRSARALGGGDFRRVLIARRACASR